ncbi:MAG TPA: hypothetical protein VHL98_15710 [Microvirga sp.]|jgi:hypothetical protein|nr:hypothetical protein [Microvirga sp.]
MNHTIDTPNAAADAAQPVPSLKVAFVGFVTSTTLACTVMVILSSL